MPLWAKSFDQWFDDYISRDQKTLESANQITTQQYVALKEMCRIVWEASRQNMTTRDI